MSCSISHSMELQERSVTSNLLFSVPVCPILDPGVLEEVLEPVGVSLKISDVTQ